MNQSSESPSAQSFLSQPTDSLTLPVADIRQAPSSNNPQVVNFSEAQMQVTAGVHRDNHYFNNHLEPYFDPNTYARAPSAMPADLIDFLFNEELYNNCQNQRPGEVDCLQKYAFSDIMIVTEES